MLINSSEKPKRFVSDWEFEYLTGHPKVVTVDESLGDTWEKTPDEIVFHLVEQPSALDPDSIAPAKDIFINRRNLKDYTVTKRVFVELTPEQKELWRHNVEKIYGQTPKKPSQVR